MRFFATIRLKQLQYTFLVIYFHLNRSDFKKFRIILKNLKMGNFWNNSIIHLFEQLPTFSCRNLLLMILIFKMAWSVLTKCGDKSSLKGRRGAVWGPFPKKFFFLLQIGWFLVLGGFRAREIDWRKSRVPKIFSWTP